MTSKETLINIILKASDETCDNVLRKLLVRVGLANDDTPDTYFVANMREFIESEHPRDEIGRFAPSGSLRDDMTKREAMKWDKTGKTNPRNSKIRDLGRKIEKLKKSVEKYEGKTSEFARQNYEASQRDLVKTQRELYEAIREAKHEEREKIEGSVLKRHMKKLAKEFHEVDDEIDYLEEKYGGDSEGSLTAMTFPNTRKGKRDKAKYEKLCKRREELTDEIDWEIVAE